jgi:nucleoside-diphosphate-sugar epimerase
MKGAILITGGAGSVGKCVAERLCAQGRAVRVFDLPHMDFSGLEHEGRVEIIRGDLTNANDIEQALKDVAALIHLAALMKPGSEKNRATTFAVNVEGTARLAEMLKRVNPEARLVFSSSVATYGDTTNKGTPITIDQPQQGIDIYADSKIAAEKLLLQIYPEAVILRISGISTPIIQSPPAIWPFMPDQRIEFIHRDDVVAALCAAVDEERAKGQIFNIAGGVTWRTTGKDYVKDYYDLLGVPLDEACFQESPGWCDWYDTHASQKILRYQNTKYPDHLARLKKEIARMMAGRL